MSAQVLSHLFTNRLYGRLFDLERQLCVFLPTASTPPSELVDHLRMLQYSQEPKLWIVMPCCVGRGDLVPDPVGVAFALSFELELVQTYPSLSLFCARELHDLRFGECAVALPQVWILQGQFGRL